MAARLKQIKIGVDPLTEAKLSLRAQQAGSTVSEYVRALIVRDLAGGGEAASRAEPTEPLSGQLLELALVTGILVRVQLARTVGEDEANKIVSRAQEKAAEQVRSLLGSDRESSP